MCVVTIECFSFGFGCKKMSKQAWHWKYRTEIVMQRWLYHNVDLGAKKERKKTALESILLMIYYVLFLFNWVPGWYFTSQLILQNDSLSAIIIMMIVIVFVYLLCRPCRPSLNVTLILLSVFTEAEHGYASVLPYSAEFSRKKTKASPISKKTQNNR